MAGRSKIQHLLRKYGTRYPSSQSKLSPRHQRELGVRYQVQYLLWKHKRMRFIDICSALQKGNPPIKTRRIAIKYLKKFMKEVMIKRDIDTRQYELTSKGEKMVSKYIKKLLIDLIDDIEHMKIKATKWYIMDLIYDKGRMGFNDVFERIGNLPYTMKTPRTLSRYLKELMKEECLIMDIEKREYMLSPKGETVYLSIEQILSTPTWQANTLLGEMRDAPCYDCKFIKWKKKRDDYECGLLYSLTDEEADKLIKSYKEERPCPFFVIAEDEKRGF